MSTHLYTFEPLVLHTNPRQYKNETKWQVWTPDTKNKTKRERFEDPRTHLYAFVKSTCVRFVKSESFMSIFARLRHLFCIDWDDQWKMKNDDNNDQKQKRNVKPPSLTHHQTTYLPSLFAFPPPQTHPGLPYPLPLSFSFSQSFSSLHFWFHTSPRNGE